MTEFIFNFCPHREQQGLTGRFEKIAALLAPVFAIGLNIFIVVSAKSESALNICHHKHGATLIYVGVASQLVLAVAVAGALINQARLRRNSDISFATKFCLVYLVSASLSHEIFQPSEKIVQIVFCVSGLVLLLLPGIPFVVVLLRNAEERKRYLKAKRSDILAFASNFKEREKWFRLLNIISAMSAATGFLSAVWGLALPWFEIEFSPEGALRDFLDTKESFEHGINKTILDLEDAAEKMNVFKNLASCEVFIAGTIAAFILATVPFVGPSAAKAQSMLLRIAKTGYRLGEKAKRLRDKTQVIRYAIQDLDMVFTKFKKLMAIGVTLDNYGLVCRIR